MSPSNGKAEANGRLRGFCVVLYLLVCEAGRQRAAICQVHRSLIVVIVITSSLYPPGVMLPGTDVPDRLAPQTRIDAVLG